MKILIVDYNIVTCHFIELDALGDEMMLEDDASYLDEAANAPAVPGTLPGESEGEKSAVRYLIQLNDILSGITLRSCCWVVSC